MAVRDMIIYLCLGAACLLTVWNPVVCIPQRCQDQLAPQNPSCGSGVKSYHFDPIKGSCKEVIYNGCGKTKNIFKTKRDCVRSCACYVEPHWGVYCGKKYRVKYWYEPESGQCREFWHSGCGGNHNKFDKMSHCEDVCTGYRSLKLEIRSLTKLISTDLQEIRTPW